MGDFGVNFLGNILNMEDDWVGGRFGLVWVCFIVYGFCVKIWNFMKVGLLKIFVFVFGF